MIWPHTGPEPYIQLALALLGLSLLPACRTEVLQTVVEAPLPAAAAGAAIGDVDEAIWRAGRKASWHIEQLRPGDLRGTWRFKHHAAVVSIAHDRRRMSIRYVSSENLLHEGNQIHRTYNRRIHQLVAQIQREPITPAPRAAPTGPVPIQEID